jgi:hypothetical protein
MNQSVETRLSKLRVLVPLAFAAIFALAFYVVGFGLLLSAGSAVFGFISGCAFLSRSSENKKMGVQIPLAKMLRGERIPSKSQSGFSTSVSEGARLGAFLSGLKKIVIRGSILQRIAGRIFIMQMAIGAVAIPLFWSAQVIGLDVNLLNNPSLARLFAEHLAFDGPSMAKARFENLFVPLTLIYAVSLPMLAAAFLYSLDAMLRDTRKNWPVLVVVPIFIVAPVLMVFHESFVARNWQRLIVAGEAWGYVVMFVLFPLCLLVLTASLPNRSSR